MRCNICQSINHWTTQCPDRPSEEITYVVDKLILQNPTDLALQTLLSETWCCVVLDTSTSGTVCGATWFQEYLDSLSANEIANVTYFTSIKPFRFGDWREVRSSKAATILVHFCTSQVCHQNRHCRSHFITIIVMFLHEKTHATSQKHFDSATIILSNLEHQMVYMLYQHSSQTAYKQIQ